MPILLFLLTVAGAVMVWYWRARATADVARGAADMGRDVIGAARQWNFKRRTNVHPVDAIEELAVAEGALAVAFLELGGMPTVEERNALLRALQSRLGVSLGEAEELVTLGHWLVGQCGGPGPAVSRLSRRAARLGGSAAVDDVAALIEMVGPREPNAAQRDALEEMERHLAKPRARA